MLDSYGPRLPQRLGEALVSVRELGLRGWLALLGISIGCAAMVALMNIGHSATQHVRYMFKGMGTELLVVSLKPEAGHSEVMALDLKDLPRDIRSTAPLAVSAVTVHLNGVSAEAMLAASTAQVNEVLDVRIAQGRALSRHDDFARHVLLGSELARQLRARPGDRLKMGSYVFDVTGVMAPQGPNPMLPVNLDDVILIPLGGTGRLDPIPQVATVLALGADAETLSQAAETLRNYLQSRLPRHEVDIQVPRRMLESMAAQSSVLTWMLAGTAAIALILGGVGVMSVMVMNVLQRRREIGVRLAMGARARDVAWLFLLEALLLSVVGAVLGVILGLASGWLFTVASGWRFVLDVWSLPISICASLTLGLFFGL